MNDEKTYKIGEVAQLLNLQPYVLRFWESEFSQICPLRSEKGTRLYTGNDLVLLRRIQHLLHEKGLTIEGAKRVLSESGEKPEEGGIFQMIRKELLQIRDLLSAGDNDE